MAQVGCDDFQREERDVVGELMPAGSKLVNGMETKSNSEELESSKLTARTNRQSGGETSQNARRFSFGRSNRLQLALDRIRPGTGRQPTDRSQYIRERLGKFAAPSRRVVPRDENGLEDVDEFWKSSSDEESPAKDLKKENVNAAPSDHTIISRDENRFEDADSFWNTSSDEDSPATDFKKGMETEVEITELPRTEEGNVSTVSNKEQLRSRKVKAGTRNGTGSSPTESNNDLPVKQRAVENDSPADTSDIPPSQATFCQTESPIFASLNISIEIETPRTTPAARDQSLTALSKQDKGITIRSEQGESTHIHSTGLNGAEEIDGYGEEVVRVSPPVVSNTVAEISNSEFTLPIWQPPCDEVEVNRGIAKTISSIKMETGKFTEQPATFGYFHAEGALTRTKATNYVNKEASNGKENDPKFLEKQNLSPSAANSSDFNEAACQTSKFRKPGRVRKPMKERNLPQQHEDVALLRTPPAASMVESRDTTTRLPMPASKESVAEDSAGNGGQSSPEQSLKKRARDDAQPHMEERRKISRRCDFRLRDSVKAGTKWENGLRRSTRTRIRPLQYWRNERVIYGRSHSNLPTIEKVQVVSPDPKWPLPSGKKKTVRPLVQLQFNKELGKNPGLNIARRLYSQEN